MKWKESGFNETAKLVANAKIKHTKLYSAQRMYNGHNKWESGPQEKEEAQGESKQET